MSEGLYFRQLLAGHDFAVGNDLARSMRNFTYAIGDRASGEVLLVDPAYQVQELLDRLVADEMTLVGVVATHYHPDHIGGSFGGDLYVEGIAELLAVVDVPVHAQSSELEWITKSAGVEVDRLVAHENGDVLRVGDVAITLLHTPGHTPGSQCLLVDAHLMSGDTLFIDGCGRTDLPGGDPSAMYESLQVRLLSVADDVVVYPGHLYSAEPFMAMGQVRAQNFILAPVDEEQWLTMFGS